MPENRETQARSTGRERGRELQRGTTSDLLTQRGAYDPFAIGPFSLMRRMQEDMDRLFEDVLGGRRQSPGLLTGGGRGEWTPAIEAFQRGNEFVVRADVPGLSHDDLSVEVGDDTLTIQGERKYDHQEEREGLFRSERSYGSFYRVIPLPDGAVPESAKANFNNGVLEIVVQAPPQEVRRGRRLDIGQEKTATSGSQR
jgi:HSP20 family protein